MKKNRIATTFFFFGILFFAGAGCSNTPQIVPDPAQEEAVYVKPEGEENTLTQAYRACSDAGHSIVIQHDAKANSPAVFCVFNNGSQCDAIAFLKGACTQTDGAKVYVPQTLTDVQLLRACGVHDPSVCGTDGNNYANACVAAQKNIPVKHEGVCEKSGTSLEQKTSSSNGGEGNNSVSGQGSESTAQSQIEMNTGEDATWLQMIISLAQSRPVSSKRATIEKCTLQKNTFYKYTESGDDALQVLYDSRGIVDCFPSNDAVSACPKNLSSASCSTIWKDSR